MKEVAKNDCKIEYFISVLHFTSTILFPKYPHVVFPLFSWLYIAHRNQRRRSMKCLAKPIPSKLVEMLINNDRPPDFNGDVDSCVLVAPSILQSLNLKEGSWLKMIVVDGDISLDLTNEKLNNQDTFSKKDTCFVQAFNISDMDESTVVISDNLCHNLKEAQLFHHNKDSYVVFQKISKEIDKKNSIACDKLGEDIFPNIATKARIGLIQTPLEVENKVLDSALKSFFITPRYLCKGDIFSVDLKEYYPAVYHFPGCQNIDVLYFTVLEILGPKNSEKHCSGLQYGYHIKFGTTTLTQDRNQQSYLPKKLFHVVRNCGFLGARNYELSLVSMCPSGLDKYYGEFITSIQPFLLKDNKVKLKPMFILLGPRGVGKRELVSYTSAALGLHVWNVDCLELQGNTPGYTEGKLKYIFNKVFQFAPCILLLRNIEVLCKDKDGKEDSRVISAFHHEVCKLYNDLQGIKSYPVIIVATCNTRNETVSPIAPSLARMFLHTIRLSSPNETERLAMLDWLTRRSGVQLSSDVSLSQVAGRSSGLVFADLTALMCHANRNCYKHIKSSGVDVTSSQSLRNQDFEDALETMQAAYADAIGAPKIPSVSWNDVGGLADLKDEILRTITFPLQHPELASTGLRRSGLLLYGPPGTGKTLLAKAVATECNLNFLSVKGPELLNMYVGQSEENVREVFQRARSASPCIIFFDELDSLAPNRGRSGDSGGVMDRVVSQLLAELDGLQKSTHLFVIGATNRPDLIDPALLRPGRFDKLLYVGVCEDRDSQYSVLSALTRKFKLKPDVNLKEIVSKLPSNLTGADMYSVCSNAWLNAVRTCIHQLKEEGRQKTDQVVEVGLRDFEAAIATITPSVSQEDLRYFKQIRQQIAG